MWKMRAQHAVAASNCSKMGEILNLDTCIYFPGCFCNVFLLLVVYLPNKLVLSFVVILRGVKYFAIVPHYRNRWV